MRISKRNERNGRNEQSKQNRRKRIFLLSLPAVAALGAVAAVVVGPTLPLSGKGTFCLTGAATDMTLAGTGEATSSGRCVALPGKGNLSTDLMAGDIPLRGGMRLYTAQHRLDVTNLRIRIDNRTTSADLSVDGSSPVRVTFLTYAISPRHVTVTYPTVGARAMSLRLAEPAGPAFRKAFPAGRLHQGEELFTFDGTATFSSPR